MNNNTYNFDVQILGEPKISSPLKLSKVDGDYLTNYVENYERVLYDTCLNKVKSTIQEGKEPISFEKAGPREEIYFDPTASRAAIVSCGGLCPGINDVIRGIVQQLYQWYGVKSIYGFRYGYYGMVKESGLQPMILDPETVASIHEQGGSILGSSRGPQSVAKMVDRLMDYKINMLFCIGGDGTLRGAQEITNEINSRKLNIAVVGIPKTIDNDIAFIEKSFGFETAFSQAVNAISTAYVEAKGYQNGIGLVKLMGRHSGYIAANASLASQNVDFCLIPELPFDLEGENGFYKHLYEKIMSGHHAVIVVAEGVAEKFCFTGELDASGNKKLGDIGTYLRDGIKKYFKDQKIPVSLKYVDPSYMIRTAAAIPSDSIFCTQLAQHAVHAAMSGRTGTMVGLWNNVFTHVPIATAVQTRKMIDPESMFWLNVLETTGQPRWMLNTPRESLD